MKTCCSALGAPPSASWPPSWSCASARGGGAGPKDLEVGIVLTLGTVLVGTAGGAALGGYLGGAPGPTSPGPSTLSKARTTSQRTSPRAALSCVFTSSWVSPANPASAWRLSPGRDGGPARAPRRGRWGASPDRPGTTAPWGRGTAFRETVTYRHRFVPHLVGRCPVAEGIAIGTGWPLPAQAGRTASPAEP
jgi:hypothetical protein